MFEPKTSVMKKSSELNVDAVFASTPFTAASSAMRAATREALLLPPR
jgi:hypothetical protein